MFSFAKGGKDKTKYSSKEKRKQEQKEKVRDEFEGKEIDDIKANYTEELEVSTLYRNSFLICVIGLTGLLRTALRWAGFHKLGSCITNDLQQN